jgi:hypothetical protein
MGNSKVIQQIWVLLERIDVALVTRDPGTARSAEAYDGLRKQLNQASKNRRIHVSHLLSLSDSIERGAEYELVKDRVSDFLVELGISRSSDLSRPDFFEITGGSGDYLKCRIPAIVETLDDGTVSLVRLGEAERTSEASVGQTLQHLSENGEAPESESIGVKVAVGVTIAIIGFFFGWIISTIMQDGSIPTERQPPEVTVEIKR